MALPDPVSTFGPFLIPAALFVVGAAGYAVLRLASRRDLHPWRDESADPDGDETDAGG